MKVWNPSFFARNFSCKHDPRFKTKSSDRMSHPLYETGIPNCGPRYSAVDFWRLRESSRRKLLWFWTHWKTPPQKWTNVPFLKGPFQKEISSSNHWFSGDVLVFWGSHTPMGVDHSWVPCSFLWNGDTSIAHIPWKFYILFSPKHSDTPMKKCLKSNPNSDHLGQFCRESYGGFLKMLGFPNKTHRFSY